MFPVMRYIQSVVSEISKEVKKMLHYDGDTHQAATALERLHRAHLNLFHMVRMGQFPWPPSQETKTKTQTSFKTKHSCWEGPRLVGPTAAPQRSQPWGAVMGKKRRA